MKQTNLVLAPVLGKNQAHPHLSQSKTGYYYSPVPTFMWEGCGMHDDDGGDDDDDDDLLKRNYNI